MKYQNYLYIGIFLFLFPLAGLFAQSGLDKFTVGITQFTQDSPKTFDAYLEYSLSQMLYKRLALISSHVISENEKQEWENSDIFKKKYSLGSSLGQKVRQRDLNFLSIQEEYNRIETLRKADIQINTEKTKAEQKSELGKLSKNKIDLVFWTDHKKGLIIPNDTSSIKELSKKYNLAMVISGKLTNYASSCLISVQVYNAISDKVLLEYETLSSLDDFTSAVDELASACAPLLMGEEPVSVTIKTNTEDISVFVDNKLLMTGPGVLPFLTEGEHTLLFTKRGFISQTKKINLKLKDDTEILVELQQETTRTVRISSLPIGANVYADSVFLGLTPLDITIAQYSKNIVVSYEGYRAQSFILQKNYVNDIQISLEKKEETEVLSFDIAKDNFYNSLGLFMLTLPLTSFSYGMFDTVYKNELNYNANASLKNATNEAALLNAHETWRSAVIGSSILSGLGAINAIFNLVLYIQSTGR